MLRAVASPGLSAIEPLVAAIEGAITRPIANDEPTRALVVEAVGVLTRVGKAPSAAAALDIVAELNT